MFLKRIMPIYILYMLLKVLLKDTTIICFSVQKDLVIDNMLKALNVGPSSAFSLTFKQFY